MMKIFLGALAIVAIFLSCEKKTDSAKIKNQENVVEKVDSVKISLDSIKVKDSCNIYKNVMAVYERKALVFEGLNKKVLDSLYENVLFVENTPAIKSYSKENILSRINLQKDQYLTKNSSNENYEGYWFETYSMDVYSRLSDFMTIQYFGEWYGGGAHGGLNSSFKTVDLKQQKIVQLQDILDIDKVKWQPILIKHVERESLFDENINFNRNFYFDKSSITFVYNQYEIGPYSSSIIEIKVPFTEIKQYLKPEFKKRLNIK